MKIYFAGSIRGGRSDAKIYSELINHLKQYGEVLTEHVGNQMVTHLGNDGPNDNWIYKRDMNWLEEADVVVAEVSTPSIGVGYEIRKAEELKKKILCLYRNQENKKLSAMVSGNGNLKIINYNTIKEAKEAINQFLK